MQKPTPEQVDPYRETEVPESVLVIGLGPTKHQLIDYQTAHDPSIHHYDEVWGMNAAVNWYGGALAFDILFVMDYLDGEAAKHQGGYVDRITEWAERHPDSRVLTSTWRDSVFDRHGNIQAYPLAGVWDAVRSACPAFTPYFHNSLPYLLAYGWALGVKRMYLWGCDYHHPTLGAVREDGRANAEFWTGWCLQSGMEVYVPDSTTLLDANQGVWWYGFPRTPSDQPVLDQQGRVTFPKEARHHTARDVRAAREVEDRREVLEVLETEGRARGDTITLQPGESVSEALAARRTSRVVQHRDHNVPEVPDLE